jgi:hypothetical protein
MGARREIKVQIRDLLVGLGEDRSAVAGTLARAGVQGVPADADRCAVAQYLQAVVGADPRVESIGVHVGHVRVWLSDQRRLHLPVRVRVPGSVRKFVAAFDASVYPTLIRTTMSRLDRPAPKPVASFKALQPAASDPGGVAKDVSPG